MFGGAAAMSGGGHVMQCTPMTVNLELNSRRRTGGKLGGSSGRSSDTIGRVVSLWGRSGSLRDHRGWRYFSVQQGCRGIGVRERQRGRSFGRPGRSGRVVMRSGGDKTDSNLGDDGVETLFMRELRRRGMSTKEMDGAPLGSTGTDTKTKEESEGSKGFFRGWSLPGAASTKPPPQLTQSEIEDQLKRSQALNSEGLDGLIPRGTELLKLGSSFFLVFWPLILASLVAFGAVYLYFGSAFIHPGNRFEDVGRPPYVDPYQLLEEEGIPPQIGPNRVPFNARGDDPRNDGSFP